MIILEEEKIFVANTIKEVKMIFDPYRLKILSAIFDNKEEMTVKQVATVLGEAPNKVHYHVKKLYDFGALKLVRTESINGIIAKFYTNAYAGYSIGTDDNSTEVMNVKKTAVINAFDDAVNAFKKDIVTYMNLVAEKGKEHQRGLQINYETLYLSKEDLEELRKEMTALFEKYETEDNDKEVYTTINTLARIK